jgi:diketogulonate reductase-like aldo/keto reductase
MAVARAIFLFGCAAALQDTVEIAPGVQMPLMNLGNYNLSSNSSLWLSVGGRGLDTAMSYHDPSLAETGAAVRNSGLPRSDIFVTSKIECGQTTTLSPEEAIAHSFDVLELDYVDLMVMHWPCPEGAEATAKYYKAMEGMIANGTARAIGISNFNAKEIDELLEVATVKPAVNQCQFSVGYHDDEALQRCKDLGITYSAYSPLGGLENPVDVLHDLDVSAVAAAHNRSTAEVALRWVVQQGVVAVSSTTKESHMRSDLSIFDEGFELSDEEMSRLHAVGSTTALV